MLELEVRILYHFKLQFSHYKICNIFIASVIIKYCVFTGVDRWIILTSKTNGVLNYIKKNKQFCSGYFALREILILYDSLKIKIWGEIHSWKPHLSLNLWMFGVWTRLGYIFIFCPWAHNSAMGKASG